MQRADIEIQPCYSARMPRSLIMQFKPTAQLLAGQAVWPVLLPVTFRMESHVWKE